MPVSSQTAVKGERDIEMAVGWIICAAGTGARYKIKPIVFEVCTRDQARFRLFLCVFIAATQKFKLEKNTLNTKE